MSLNGKSSVENRRLDSWKEIATFFGRDERTAKRWEKDRSLPVHRVPGTRRGGVFAYTDELTNWLNSPPAEKEGIEAPPPASAFESVLSEVRIEPEQELALPSEGDPRPTPPSTHRLTPVRVIGLAILILVTAIMIRSAIRHARGNAPGSGTRRVSVKRVPNAEAVEFYLKGRYYWNRRTSESLTQAVDAFTQAIVHDPSYAEAYAGLADSYDLMREYTAMPASEAYPRAIAAASKSVELDASLSEAHRALAFGLFNWNWEVPRALAEYRKALELDPNDVEAYHWYATALLSLGRFDESFAEIEKARGLNPGSPSILADRGLILYWTGNYNGGITVLEEIEQAEPAFLSPPRYLASLYFEQRNYAGFIAQTKRAALISKDAQESALAEAAERGWSRGGEIEMLEEIERSQRHFFEQGQSSGFQLANTCVLLGRKKDAVRYLQSAYAAHDSSIFGITRGRFETDLSGDPGFEQLKSHLLAFIEARS
jgi:tetratricopeptide (TPR) repeat protein